MFILTLSVGAVIGYLSTRFYGVKSNDPIIIGIGIVGAIIGGILLRSLIAVLATISGVVAFFIGGFLGAIVLIWIYHTYFRD